MSDKSNIDSLLDELGLSDDTDIEKKRKRDIRIGTSEDEDLTNSINSYLNKDKKIFNTDRIYNGIKEYDSNRSVASNVVKTNFDLDLTDEQKEDALEFTKSKRIESVYKMTESLKKSEANKLRMGSDGVIIGVTVLSFITDIWYSLLMLLYGYKISSLFRRFVEKGNKDCWLDDGNGGKKPLFSPIADNISYAICNIQKVGTYISFGWPLILCFLCIGLGIVGVISETNGAMFMILMTLVFPFITVVVFVLNLFVNHDKKLQNAYSNKNTFDSDLTSFNEKADKDYQDELVKINNMTIEDLTSKEKVAYLKHIGFLTKRTEVQKIDNESTEDVSLDVTEEATTEETVQV